MQGGNENDGLLASDFATTGTKTPTRRTFLYSSLLGAAASVLFKSKLLAEATKSAQVADPDLVHDTLNGLIAFVVPGPDAYSEAQGVSTIERGGVHANIPEILILTLDLSAPFLPKFSGVVAGILNDLAQKVNPAAPGSFVSPFSKLSFREKAAVFQIMDSTDSLKLLGGVIPAIVAYLCYSDAAVFDPATRTLKGKPIGWTLSNYSGVADGRDEFRGYYKDDHSSKPLGVSRHA
jgi:hypothetical protein